MEINDLISSNVVVANPKATSKKQVLQDLSRRAADATGLHERAIFDVLMERERLGTTGVGNGIAIPHGKLLELDRLHGHFARLEQPVDFQSIDERPVDLIFLLLAPESAGLIISRPWPRFPACFGMIAFAKSYAVRIRVMRSTPS